MKTIDVVNRFCSHNNFVPTELYSFNGGDVYVRYETEEKEEFDKFLKKLADLWTLRVVNYSVISWNNLEIRIKRGV
tara:strand:- start:889 stop:1116 length:228 start_codon:yes stop_codon:yes gene_type:complete